MENPRNVEDAEVVMWFVLVLIAAGLLLYGSIEAHETNRIDANREQTKTAIHEHD